MVLTQKWVFPDLWEVPVCIVSGLAQCEYMLWMCVWWAAAQEWVYIVLLST